VTEDRAWVIVFLSCCFKIIEKEAVFKHTQMLTLQCRKMCYTELQFLATVIFYYYYYQWGGTFGTAATTVAYCTSPGW
jgi:hypothetical protein